MSFQPDLFGDYHRGETRPRSGSHRPRKLPDIAELSDGELLGRLQEADPRDIERVCSEILSRSLAVAAVPLLEGLWRRFLGFGVSKPLPEQICVLRTLAGLDHDDARATLKRIVSSNRLPTSLYDVALQAAAEARLTVPAGLVQPLLEHPDPDVRVAAFRLSHPVRLSPNLLRQGLRDLSAAVRREAAITLGLGGFPEAKTILLNELAAQPSDTLIAALVAIWDDDVIVHLGRCAAAHPALAGLVADFLEEMDDPKALAVAERLRKGPS